ncbi:hypothetical protein C8J56DRAFT_33119 [Mycena floridula]|nr:hypothetical protein C8J56DRAFT_33119 [Mycena floridula]
MVLLSPFLNHFCMPHRKRSVGPVLWISYRRFMDALAIWETRRTGRDVFFVVMFQSFRTSSMEFNLVYVLYPSDRDIISTKEPFSLWVSFTLTLKVSLPIAQTSPSRRCLHLRVRCDEFKLWLRDEKGKYFNELSGEKARSYFRKFVKVWNCGSLSRSLYAGDIEPLGTTSYKWSFAKSKGRDDDKVSSCSQDTHKSKSSSSAGPSRVLGPTLPSTVDLVLAREREEEERKAERSYKWKRDKAEDKERIGEMVGP